MVKEINLSYYFLICHSSTVLRANLTINIFFYTFLYLRTHYDVSLVILLTETEPQPPGHVGQCVGTMLLIKAKKAA